MAGDITPAQLQRARSLGGHSLGATQKRQRWGRRQSPLVSPSPPPAPSYERIPAAAAVAEFTTSRTTPLAAGESQDKIRRANRCDWPYLVVSGNLSGQ